MSIIAGSLYAGDGGILAGLLIAPDDTEAAQFTAGPAVSLITQTGLRVAFTVNEAATVYGIAVAQGSAVPTPEQIIAGVDYGAVTVLDARQVSVAAGVSNHLTFADIVGQAGNNVRAYLTAVDAAGNIQAQGDILAALAQLLPEVTPDTTPPVITLAGANPITLFVGQAYVEPGYSAVDDVDGVIAQDAAGWIVNSNHNPNTVGSYSVTYQIADQAGNVATATRLINVVESASAISSGLIFTLDAAGIGIARRHMTTDETRAISIDFSAVLDAEETILSLDLQHRDGITTSSYGPTMGPIDSDGSAIAAGKACQFMVTAQSPGRYRIEALCATSGSQVIEGRIVLHVSQSRF